MVQKAKQEESSKGNIELEFAINNVKVSIGELIMEEQDNGDPNIIYNIDEDCTYVICPECDTENKLEGNQTYGFYSKCRCGYQYNR